eukprot:gnl/TRDRNA2_/TRDRNA2_193138_c0_seq1.p1 gnl/TRDRNA2_/TRDRNA2_193138_c0~~gnl/TRDRNA2_/TRDRNA2_193138_c0_seq1.p1  ORF type:complete len:272 (-),score=51.75 gnl/TRDRNA2_/TRDRNA2_193138_c0_seq1:66-812(-)
MATPAIYRAAGGTFRCCAQNAAPTLRFFAATTAAASRVAEGSTSGWPEKSFVFEPPWEASGLPRAMLLVPNALETYFRLREAQRQLRAVPGAQDAALETVDEFNDRFMQRFLELHADVERSAQQHLRRQATQSRSGGARAVAPAVPSGRLDLAASGARTVWMAERPQHAVRWETTPHSCQVVQARRAEHHGRRWVQVTTRLTAEERWQVRGGALESRVREHFVVYELPDGLAAGDFRIAEIVTEASPP